MLVLLPPPPLPRPGPPASELDMLEPRLFVVEEPTRPDLPTMVVTVRREYAKGERGGVRRESKASRGMTLFASKKRHRSAGTPLLEED